MENILSFWDILGVVIYLPIILIVSFLIKNRNIGANPVYKYYIPGLIAKIIGSITFCLVYALHYKGGDTVNYYMSSLAMNNLMMYNFDHYWDLMTGGRFWYFNMVTGVPAKYMFDDPQTFFVVRLANPLIWFGFKSFVTSSILLSWLTYAGIWRFYLMFNEIYPKLHKRLAYAILFIPSPLFWGGGISKDTFAYTSTLWLVYCFYMIFIKKNKVFINILIGIVNILLLLNIKPYIFIVLFPLLLTWLLYHPISRMKSHFLKVAMAPAILIIGLLLGTTGLTLMSGSLGQYSTYDKIITKAQVTQEDHLREEAYGTNNYDIGTFDGSLGSMLSVTPLAIFTGLYRPFIFEAKNFVMFMSGMENLYLMFLTFLIIFKTGLIKAFNRVISEPLLLLSVLFTILFSLGIGISAANFGALVRFKIPLIPFFTSAIAVMVAKYQEEKEEIENKKKEEERQKAFKKTRIPGVRQ